MPYSANILIALVMSTLLGMAGSDNSLASSTHDHDRARKAVESGEVLPLKIVLGRVEKDYPGEVMEVELERDDGRWIYEIKILRPGGSLIKLKVNARDGAVLHSEVRRSSRERDRR